jgi:transposase
VLLTYSRGIISSIKIAGACEGNIIFMALTGGLTPDFSTIANFISSLGTDIKDIFIDVLMVCEELNLPGATVMLD